MGLMTFCFHHSRKNKKQKNPPRQVLPNWHKEACSALSYRALQESTLPKSGF